MPLLCLGPGCSCGMWVARAVAGHGAADHVRRRPGRGIFSEFWVQPLLLMNPFGRSGCQPIFIAGWLRVMHSICSIRMVRGVYTLKCHWVCCVCHIPLCLYLIQTSPAPCTFLAHGWFVSCSTNSSCHFCPGTEWCLTQTPHAVVAVSNTTVVNTTLCWAQSGLCYVWLLGVCGCWACQRLCEQ